MKAACIGKESCIIGGAAWVAHAADATFAAFAGAPGEPNWAAVEVLCEGGEEAVTIDLVVPMGATVTLAVPIDAVMAAPGSMPVPDKSKSTEFLPRFMVAEGAEKMMIEHKLANKNGRNFLVVEVEGPTNPANGPRRITLRASGA